MEVNSTIHIKIYEDLENVISYSSVSDKSSQKKQKKNKCDLKYSYIHIKTLVYIKNKYY